MKPDFKFWAKTSIEQVDGADPWSSYHPVICHLIDVGCVCEAFLRGTAPDLRSHYLSILSQDVDEETGIRALSATVGAHDLGKLSPFQAKAPQMVDDLKRRGYPLDGDSRAEDHGLVSYGALLRELPIGDAAPDHSKASLAHMVAAHHGRFYDNRQLKYAARTFRSQYAEWADVQRQHVAALFDAFELSVATPLELSQAPLPVSAAMMLAGLTTLVDWIGSDETTFPYQAEVPSDLKAYRKERLAIAGAALRNLGLINRLSVQQKSFHALFGFDRLNATQKVLSDGLKTLSWPFLAIVESPTGEGKTEAALWAYSRFFRKECRGLYYALPTQTTGNSMFARVQEFLAHLTGGGDVTQLHLLHGDARFNDDYAALRFSTVNQHGNDTGEGPRAAMWFVGKKRGLIAEHGVGTVDQAMLAAIRSKHFFVRLFALADKLVVIDEVHAYDVYMSRIIDVLIGWLHALNTSVILLSATLPHNRKKSLLKAFVPAHRDTSEIDDSLESMAPYPAVKAADTNMRLVSDGIPGVASRSISIETVPAVAAGSGPGDWQETKLAYLAELLLRESEGAGVLGCVVNTVKEAQSLYGQLKESIDPAVTLVLFHSRLTRADRARVEEFVVERLGPDKDRRHQASRPKRAIVVATQVIEQSIDVDFDYLVTDLAPIDLLLQRMGRLHRHKRERSERHRKPRVAIAIPPEDSSAAYAPASYIYFPDILRRTKQVLLEHGPTVAIPHDVAAMVNAVYTLEQAPEQEMNAWLGERLAAQQFQEIEAGMNCIPPLSHVTDQSSYADGGDAENVKRVINDITNLFDQDEAPVTRDADESLSLVVVSATDELPSSPTANEVRQLADRSLRLPKRVVEFKLDALETPPAGWRQIGYLKDVMVLRVDENGRCVEDSSVAYDSQIGLTFAS